ncbi:hypothetical protein NUSPORA_00738 [Nucleospora cyclopteri]
MDLNLVDERVIAKYKKEAVDSNRGSWYLSYCMDLNQEERERGKTQEISFTTFDLPTCRINVIDSPGHKTYVNEMIEGAARAETGILIVSARQGEFESGFKGGQTKEHVRLLKAANVRQLIILVNKMDEVEWSSERYSFIAGKISKFTDVLFPKAPIIPVSGFLGDNISKSKKLDFYKGGTFLEYLDTMPLSQADQQGEGTVATVVEKVKSANTYFFVRLERGILQKGSEYLILPCNKKDKVVSLQNYEEIEVEKADPIDLYRVKLAKVSEEISIGSKLLMDAISYRNANLIYAKMGIYDVNRPITVGYSMVFHCGLQSSLCKIESLYGINKKPIRVVKKAEKAIVLLRLETTLVLQSTKGSRDRFSLRDEDRTIGVGEVSKIVE